MFQLFWLSVINIILLYLLVFNSQQVYAKNASESAQQVGNNLNITYEAINPSDDYRYLLKRLKEKILLFVYSYSPSKKADYYLELTTNRLAELKYIVDKKDIANIETGSNRYSATIGELTQFINENDPVNKKGVVKEILAVNIKILELLRDKFPGGAGWLFIQQNIDSTKINLEKLQ